MEKEKALQWLRDNAQGAFMDLFYYDRKECEDMSVDQINALIKNNTITKQEMKKVFNDLIEEEYK